MNDTNEPKFYDVLKFNRTNSQLKSNKFLPSYLITEGFKFKIESTDILKLRCSYMSYMF